MRIRCVVVAAMLIALAACGSGTEVAEPVPIPAGAESSTGDEAVSFEPAAGSLAEFVGTRFDEAELPAELFGGSVRGGAIVNSEIDPSDAETVAMFWAVNGESANFVTATMVERDPSGEPIWRADSAWVLHLGEASYLTIGSDVCMAPDNSFDWRNGELVVVTDTTWERPLGAWTMTGDGPQPYANLALLDCERFVP